MSKEEGADAVAPGSIRGTATQSLTFGFFAFSILCHLPIHHCPLITVLVSIHSGATITGAHNDRPDVPGLQSQT